MTPAFNLESLSGGLVVSCQPVDGGPLDRDDIVARFAQAAELSGACAVRIEGATRVARVRGAVKLPIIGIVKRDLDESPVRITPFLSDVSELAAAGANIVAVDATSRKRPASVESLLHAIHASGAYAMADCSTRQDALVAHAMGFDIIGTTLSGYTGSIADIPDAPDIALVRELASLGYRVMAEGRYNTPDEAAQAIAAGAWAVTVGSAITRPEIVTGWFRTAMSAATALPNVARVA
ncbi:MAG: N-acetylmannosamine-6-phosphate 2-epimerase [Casimicrobium sp.]